MAVGGATEDSRHGLLKRVHRDAQYCGCSERACDVKKNRLQFATFFGVSNHITTSIIADNRPLW